MRTLTLVAIMFPASSFSNLKCAGECTCTGNPDDDRSWICRDFACVDPSAPCVDDDSITIEMADNCRVRGIGDGYCDIDNNNEICSEFSFDPPSLLFFLVMLPQHRSAAKGTLCIVSIAGDEEG